MKKLILGLLLLFVAALTCAFLLSKVVIGLFESIMDPAVPSENPMRSNIIAMGKEDGKILRYGFIEHSGKLVIPATFDDCSKFHEDRCAVRLKNQWGFIDNRGKQVIPTQYDRVHDFNEGLAAARHDRLWGFIDKQGNWIIQPTWLAVTDFHHGRATVGSGAPRVKPSGEPQPLISRETSAIIDKSGKFVMAPHQGVIGPEIDGRIAYCLATDSANKRFGFLNEKGENVVQAKFEDGRLFSEGLAAVREHGKWGFIDKNGAVVIPATFEQAGSFRNGVATAALNNKFGIIDRSGKFVVQPTYGRLSGMSIVPSDPVEQFNNEGLMPVAFNKRWGFADTKTGKIVIKPMYWQVDTFSEGLARVELEQNEDTEK